MKVTAGGRAEAPQITGCTTSSGGHGVALPGDSTAVSGVFLLGAGAVLVCGGAFVQMRPLKSTDQ